jgi:hypothetical protein
MCEKINCTCQLLNSWIIRCWYNEHTHYHQQYQGQILKSEKVLVPAKCDVGPHNSQLTFSVQIEQHPAWTRIWFSC